VQKLKDFDKKNRKCYIKTSWLNWKRIESYRSWKHQISK